ncbi:cancer/testis antigen 55 [Neovison vison]|uniref:cancer/testis antigen 55 n=1 Tax=Neovison vison TaxID=452646 RepID=UPI001CF02A5C|nr:cancer/testis antigen 55 [Neogale vison]
MLRFISRVLAFFRRRVDSSEAEREQHMRLLEGGTRLKTVHGVVTNICSDSGLIDDLIYFSSDVVTGDVPLKVGQEVTAIVGKDKTYGLKAIKVDALCDSCHGNGPPDSYARVSFGCVSTVVEGANYIDHTTYFSLDVVCKGFEPYQGDRVEVEFCTPSDTLSRRALSVKPQRHKHVHEVCITSLHGRNGVIDDSIFFTLESLKLPAGYTPQVSDVVNAVVVESIQSCYTWRAISMTPVKSTIDDPSIGTWWRLCAEASPTSNPPPPPPPHNLCPMNMALSCFAVGGRVPTAHDCRLLHAHVLTQPRTFSAASCRPPGFTPSRRGGPPGDIEKSPFLQEALKV